MALSFAILNCNVASYGLVQTFDQDATAQIADARGCDGKVEEQIAYSVDYENKVKVLLNAGGTLPTAGSSETLGDLTGLVSNVHQTEANTEFKTAEVTVKKSDQATQTEYA